MQSDAVREALRDWLDPGDGDEPVDLGAKFGLVSGDGAVYPNGYFNQKLGAGFGVDLRALQVGIEVKDLFAEANRPPARPSRAFAHEWNGFGGAQDTGNGRDTISEAGHHREKVIEWPRPRSWRRP